MKKSLLFVIGMTGGLLGAEFQFGSGTFTMEGGFLGLSGDIDNDVSSFTLTTRHANIGSGNIFYSYDLNWLDSKDLVQAQQSYNNIASALNVPEMEYRVKGMDFNMKVGYDVMHQDEDNFLGVGVLVGLSVPWIDSTKGDSAVPNTDFLFGNMGNMQDAQQLFKDTKTKVMTYKIGPTINFQKALVGNKLSVYGLASYAYQTGWISNDYMKSDLDVDGTYQEYGFGLYFTPFTEKFDWGWITLSPRVFATLGYKYSKWDMGDVSINIAGKGINSGDLVPYETTFTMSSSIGYFGLGYSF